MSGESPLILVDFDGVLNISPEPWRLAAMLRQGWQGGVACLDGGCPERVCCNPRAGRWLTSLASETGGELAWATMREAVARSRCAPLTGLPDMPVVPVLAAMSSGAAVTKAESVVPWTRGRPFVWFDDLAGECEAADCLAQWQPHLMVWVDPRHGLGEEHIATARDWLLARPS